MSSLKLPIKNILLKNPFGTFLQNPFSFSNFSNKIYLFHYIFKVFQFDSSWITNYVLCSEPVNPPQARHPTNNTLVAEPGHYFLVLSLEFRWLCILPLGQLVCLPFTCIWKADGEMVSIDRGFTAMSRWEASLLEDSTLWVEQRHLSWPGELMPLMIDSY